MARKPRIDPPGSWHHVVNRGANHQITFIDDYDRKVFLAVLSGAVRKFGIEIHAYCLMPNHYHLLIYSPDGQLSRAMKFIGQSYTQSFNWRHDRDGALFKGRFHSTLIDSDNYLDTVARYIHRNPILEYMEDDTILDTYVWSSYAVYVGERSRPEWLSTHAVLERFKTLDDYERFVRNAENRDEDPLSLRQRWARKLFDNPFRQGVVLGDASFLNAVEKRAGPAAEKYRPWILPLRPDRTRSSPTIA